MPKFDRSISNMIRNHLFKDERGAALLEYVLIASLISIAAISAMTPLGAKISSTFGFIVSQFP